MRNLVLLVFDPLLQARDVKEADLDAPACLLLFGLLLSDLDDEFLDDVRKMEHKNLAVEMLEKLLNDEEFPEKLGEPFSILTKRELEILPLVAKGYGNKDIAEMLFVSVKTVEAHKARIMEKLSLSTRPELVEYAMKKKLIDF